MSKYRGAPEPTTRALDEGKFTIELQSRAIDDDTSGAPRLALNAARVQAVRRVTERRPLRQLRATCQQ